MKLEEKNPNGTVTIEQKEYTTADAMLESFIELGVSHVFVNLGSDHGRPPTLW